jgi:ectoine hydroxylase-related dioxygenase (phytanoyl-CoA dioxygenase family)
MTQLELPPGSIVLIHSECPHYSDPNKSNSLRRAYMLQLTQKPLLLEENGKSNELISMGVKIKI